MSVIDISAMPAACTSKSSARVTFAELKPVYLSAILNGARKPAQVTISAPETSRSRLLPNDTLISEQLISASGKYTCQISNAGALTITGQCDGSVVKVLPRLNKVASSLHLQSDGNLVLEDDSCNTIWTSRTKLAQQTNDVALVMQDDGFLVLFADKTPIWASSKGFWNNWSQL